jgi:hypothetical protein
MKLKQLILLASFGAFTILAGSCSKDSANENDSSGETNISATGGNKSHNTGQNCMNCHKSGGSGEGYFNVAGSVYNAQLSAAYPNAVVKLYTQANGGGTLRATVYADAKGNFYTTANIDFSGGLYPAITGTSGNISYMPVSTTVGACNNCHGGSTAKLSVN